MRKVFVLAAVVVLIGALVPAVVFASPGSAPSAQDPTPTTTSSQAQEAKPWIGVRLADLNARLARNLEIDKEQGVVVLDVVAGSPADNVLQADDIILAVNGKPVKRVSQVVKAVKTSQAGDTLEFTVYREGQEGTVSVTVGEQPTPKETQPSGIPGLFPLLGLFGTRLSQAQVTLIDEDGTPVVLTLVSGTVSALDGTTLKVKPRDGSDEVPVTVGSDTPIFSTWGRLELTDINVGDTVTVLSKDGEVQGVWVGPLGPLQKFQSKLQHPMRMPMQGFRSIGPFSREDLGEHMPGYSDNKTMKGFHEGLGKQQGGMHSKVREQ